MVLDKIVLVTRKTRLDELIARFNTRAQAKFYITHSGGDFSDYEREDDAYRRALDEVRGALGLDLKVQLVDRAFVPTFLFAEGDLVVTLGQDGLVANTAKYVGAQPLVAVNPDPARFDGVLLPFLPKQARAAVERVANGSARIREVTLGEARLADGQRLLAFNDLFLGAQTHVSARYRIGWGGATESQSSSGVLVSTGAGSTGWLSSVFNMAAGVSALFGGGSPQAAAKVAMEWEDPRLAFVVREPFASKHSKVGIVGGVIAAGEELVIESLMPRGGAIFSDGVEPDFLAFDAGAIARVKSATQRARLVVG
jgi:NAD kinase